MSEITKAKIAFLAFFVLGIVFGILVIVHSRAAVGPALASAFFSGGLFEAIRREGGEDDV